MPLLNNIVYYAIHPAELKSIVQWNVWHTPVHERDEESEAISLKRCFHFLDQTSRSFSAVIQELNPELLVPVCVFYLILRGLDTIEDDMTIALEEKDPLLRDFHTIIDKDGWTYDGNGPAEKDRELLVQFHCVVTEFQKMKTNYQVIIKNIAKKMGNGMANYAENAEHNINGINTTDEYQEYCHYVAGLVGEGLTRLFVESGLANPALLKRTDLHESMGQFLQQTNIIRDIHEDMEDKRRFWPKQIWSKYVDKFEDLFKIENREKALRCSSEMVALALERADDCIFYLAGIRDQSVFNFAAIPQSMAIATLEECFRNPLIFEKNVKITKGKACQLMLESSQNLQMVCNIFKRYARKIHKKNDSRDPNFLTISIACGKIEQFCESIFPSQDPKAIVHKSSGGAEKPLDRAVEAKRRKEAANAKEDVIWMFAVSFLVFLVIAAVMFFVAWLFGARFDLGFRELLTTGIFKKTPGLTGEFAQTQAHGEL